MKNIKSKPYWIYGKYPVLAAIQNPRREVLELVLTDSAVNFLGINGIKLNDESIRYRTTDNATIAKMFAENVVHQGLAAKVLPVENYDLSEFIDIPKSTVLMLDQITDPHNVGAIIRSAAAFNANAVVVTHRYSPAELGILSKSSAGMSECIAIVSIANLATSIDYLKENGYWILGLDANGKDDLTSQIHKFDKTVIVLGAEGAGLRTLTRKKCDILVRIPMDPATASLNVSNAAAIALYERFNR